MPLQRGPRGPRGPGPGPARLPGSQRGLALTAQTRNPRGHRKEGGDRLCPAVEGLGQETEAPSCPFPSPPKAPDPRQTVQSPQRRPHCCPVSSQKGGRGAGQREAVRVARSGEVGRERAERK